MVAYLLDVHGAADYNNGNGALLNVWANGGNQVLSYRIRNDPECIHVWGTTLNGLWSPVNC